MPAQVHDAVLLTQAVVDPVNSGSQWVDEEEVANVERNVVMLPQRGGH